MRKSSKPPLSNPFSDKALLTSLTPWYWSKPLIAKYERICTVFHQSLIFFVAVRLSTFTNFVNVLFSSAGNFSLPFNPSSIFMECISVLTKSFFNSFKVLYGFLYVIPSTSTTYPSFFLVTFIVLPSRRACHLPLIVLPFLSFTGASSLVFLSIACLTTFSEALSETFVNP